MIAPRGPEPEATAALFFRDDAGRLQVATLPPGRPRLTLGREVGNDVELSWDARVSRLHAELARVGRDWVVADDGLSSNGTFINGERLRGRHRLRDGDVLLLGDTPVTYRADPGFRSSETVVADDVVTLLSLSETQRRVLEALCRPCTLQSPYAMPATNQEIAEELFLSTEAVKTHLRALFQRFGVGHLPQNHKRAKLVELAIRFGLVSDRSR